jgi:outer membrane protein assembly factor BamB
VHAKGSFWVVALCAAAAAAPAPAHGAVGTHTFQVDPAHTGYIYGAGVVPPLEKAWSLGLGRGNAYTVTDAGRVFAFANDGGENMPVTIDAIDLASGKIAWSQPLGTRVAYSYAAVGGGLVYTAVDGVDPPDSASAAIIVSAFDEQTGARVWTAPLDEQTLPSPPVYRDGVVYLDGEGYGATEYAIRASDGKRLWTTPTEAGNPVTLAGNILVTSSACGLAYGLYVQTGAIAWTHSEGCEGGGTFMASFDGKQVWGDEPSDDGGGRRFDAATGQVVQRFQGYAPSFGYGEAVQAIPGDSYGALKIRAFDPATGQVKWTFDEADGSLPDDGSYPSLGTVPLLADGYVFAEGSMGQLWALDPDTGAVRWHYDLAARAPYLSYDPLPGLAAGDGYLIASAGTYLTAFKGSGAPAAPAPGTSGGSAGIGPGASGGGDTSPSPAEGGDSQLGPATPARPVLTRLRVSLRHRAVMRVVVTFHLNMPAKVSLAIRRAHVHMTARRRAGNARLVIRRRALRRGTYRVRAVAVSAAGVASRPRVTRFRVR